MGIKHPSGVKGDWYTQVLHETEHTWGSDESALFKWKDPSVQLAEEAARTTDLAWTDLNATSHTSATAKAVLLLVRLVAPVVGSGNTCSIKFRQNGSSQDDEMNPQMWKHKSDATANTNYYMMLICGLDSSQLLEWEINVGTGWNINVQVFVLGYWE